MINFFKQSVHSLFNNITSTPLTCQQQSITADHHRPYGGAGLSILANYNDLFPKPNNVIESWSLMNGSRNNKEAENNKRDDVEMTTIKVVGGGDADGLGWCTESLGFESYTERSMSINEYGIDYNYEKTRVKKKSKIIDRRKEKNFPPPLKSLNENGKAMFVLKPVRKDGRLELTEVKIHRQESLHACREDGRLRIYMVELNHGNDGDIKQKQVVVEEDCRWLNEMVVSHGQNHHHNMHGW